MQDIAFIFFLGTYGISHVFTLSKKMLVPVDCRRTVCTSKNATWHLAHACKFHWSTWPQVVVCKGSQAKYFRCCFKTRSKEKVFLKRKIERPAHSVGSFCFLVFSFLAEWDDDCCRDLRKMPQSRHLFRGGQNFMYAHWKTFYKRKDYNNFYFQSFLTT